MKVALLTLVALFSLGHSAWALKVGLVLDKGGRDDKSFNSAAYQGAMEAKQRLGNTIELKVIEASDDTAIEPSLRTFAQRGYELVIGIGFVQSSAIRKVAGQFPKTHFLVVDSEVVLPNVRSVLFKEHEGSYLAGYLAAATSKTGVVGFIGGMDIPLIRRFELGYREGAKAQNPKVQVLTNYVGSTSDAWKNPTKAKELALAQYQRKADVLFAAAGASGLGVFDAAEEQKKLVIGVDSNQNGLKPGRVLTTMIKRVDLAVSESIEAANKGTFRPGIVHWGLAENAVGFSLDEHNRSLLSPELLKKAEEVRKKIIEGKVKVPDYYTVKKSS